MGYSLCHISERLKFAAQPTSIAIWQIAFASPPVAVSMDNGNARPLFAALRARIVCVVVCVFALGAAARESLGGLRKEMCPDTTLSN
jgi:hypothetical protein